MAFKTLAQGNTHTDTYQNRVEIFENSIYTHKKTGFEIFGTSI